MVSSRMGCIGQFTLFFRHENITASKLTNDEDDLISKLVGLGRLELPTSPLSGVRSNQLSYRPIQCL